MAYYAGNSYNSAIYVKGATMTTPMQPIRQQARGQVRGFVVIWTFITLVMGLATFLAIFFAARQSLPETPLGTWQFRFWWRRPDCGD
jgi:hypothetical protein